MSIKFQAQLKSVNAKTTASGDREYVLTVVTEDPNALKAGTLPTDELVTVEIT